MQHTSIKAIFFDADGTLYDSNKLHYLAYKVTAKRLYDLDLDWSTFFKEVLLKPKKGVDFLSELGITVDKESFYKVKDKLYCGMAKDKLQPMPGVRKFLHLCRVKNIRCIVVSNSKLIPLRESLISIGIESYFENIITLEDIGSQQKPYSYPYILGLKTAKLNPEHAIAIEDSAEGIESAKKAGLECIGLKHDTNVIKDLSQANIVVKHYSEIADYLNLT